MGWKAILLKLISRFSAILIKILAILCVCVCGWVCRNTQGSAGKELTCQCKRRKSCGFDPWVGKILWRRA